RLVSADVRTATSELDHARIALVSAREAAQLAADTLRLTTVAYRAGLSTNIEVIDAQTAALNADIAAALADTNERQAELDLLLASGRFPYLRACLRRDRMWIVRLALRRPYTVATMCIAAVLMGILSLRGMLTDVLPAIDIPVVIVVFNYPGLSA